MTDPPERILADGSAPHTPEELLERLEALGIDAVTVQHPPVFTVEESKALRGQLPGGHCKNLFLRNHKGRMLLLVCEEDRRLDLKALGKHLDAGRLSFGSPARLMRHLGVIVGAVTPFAVVNDRSSEVRVVLSRDLLEQEPLNFHPLDNAMTTAISAGDLVRFLEAEAHAAEIVDLSAATR